VATEFERLNQTNEEGDIISPDDFDDARYSRPDHTEYNVARLQNDFGANLPEPDYKAFKAPERQPELLTRAERLLLVKRQLGFYPVEPEELNQATMLVSDAYAGPHGTARYLNDILVHRKKYEEDHKNDPEAYVPDKALKKIVNDWIGHLSESQAEVGMLRLFINDLQQTGAKSSTELNKLSQMQDWQHEGSLRRAIAAMTREFETDEFAEKGGATADHLGESYLSRDPALVAREQQFFGKLKVGSAREISESLIKSYQKRTEFWLQQLEGAEAHLSVRPLIRSSKIVQELRQRQAAQRILDVKE